ncbi:cobalt/nickel transport system permease protein [Actinomadura hallensis]|uniref:Cobalt/nickel transport system permease protein n=1 Tax=Actinomadura hallensis TaxID=337895 RepID=A0A543IBK6_9ACTN|nr:cobalt ECF transporter T component CbiQ [Actinomadura hallensis]TQM67947.1 cobalt/nickel transport system permease protein [Actinomadura hallensis]HLV71415.1 cobalt ECF transporter T component CbiQ [Vulgatibacteraceae bacterium]
MGAGHAHRLYLPGASPVHRLPPHPKIVAVLAFVLLVVATPRERMWAFGGYALLLAAVALVAKVPFPTVARRTVIEVPFVAFAFLIPFVAEGEKITVLGLQVSESGLWDAWNILAKGTLGVVASILLAATTEPRMLLLGVERLRMPPLITQIAAFMLRYADVVLDELGRMRVARASRGFEARDVRATRVLARSVGALFLRSYERGERVHLAMVSRGYDGRMPVTHEVGATAVQWTAAALLPAAAALVALAAWIAP